MDMLPRETDRALRVSSALFLGTEHAIYIAIGLILSVAAVVALGSSAYTLCDAVAHWNGGSGLLVVMDRLLFVLMLAEILHTVRVSIQSGTLNAEPFLIVGLIASIRRVLVITLESSEATPGKAADAQQGAFQASMVELGVLAGLIMVMVVSIYLVRRSRADEPAAGH